MCSVSSRCQHDRVHPSGYEPMLASPAPRYLEPDGWAFEPKLDGWRAIVHVGEGRVSVYSRPGRDLSETVPHLSALTDAAPAGTVLDGELVAGSGRAASFYRLRPGLRAARKCATFAAFDVLAVGGRPLLAAPYEERKGALASLEFNGPGWCSVMGWTDVEVADLLMVCELHGVEGLVAKRVRSRYRPGQRSGDWLKRKTTAWKRDHAPRRRPRASVPGPCSDPTGL